ncbi:MAG: ATPase, partial [Halobacteriota archaeon]
MRLLVAGASRVDAGKTTFSAGLISTLDGSIGVKPRAGNDYWFDHDDVRASIADGRLYGGDVRRLVAAGRGAHPPELVNPVHRLWRPTPDRRGMLGEQGRTFLVDRVRTQTGDRFVVNGTAEDAGLLPDRIRTQLPIENAPRVRSIPAFNELMTETYLPAFERVRDRIGEADTVVVESYGDIAAPIDGVTFDAVAI